MEFISEKNSATEKIVESVRDLVSLKIKLPLGNPNLALVHTNQYVQTELPTDVFKMANMKAIGNKLSSLYSRGSGYTANRWYVEGVTITNDGNSATMELDLNPFATPWLNYEENRIGYRKAYGDALNSGKSNTSGNSTGTNSTTESDLKGGEGKKIDELVKKICTNKNGKVEKNAKKRAEKIHNWLLKNNNYTYYLNSKTKSPEGALKKMKNGGINCADTAKLTASMLRSANVENYIVHIPKRCGRWGHYVTIFEVDGKSYCSDTTGNHPINEYVTDCKKKNIYKGKKFWDRKCGSKVC